MRLAARRNRPAGYVSRLMCPLGLVRSLDLSAGRLEIGFGGHSFEPVSQSVGHSVGFQFQLSAQAEPSSQFESHFGRIARAKL